MSLTANIKAAVSGTHLGSLDLGPTSFSYSCTNNDTFTSGVAAGMVDKLFTDSRTLTASATEDLDCAGSMTDAFGVTFTLAKLKFIMIKALDTNTNDVVLSRPAANGVPLFAAASDAIAIKPGGTFMWVAPATGVTVTTGTGDLITVTNSAGGTSVTYEVVLMGVSA